MTSLPATFHKVLTTPLGSGKTAAYLIPILNKLMGKAKKLAAPRPNPAEYRPGFDPITRAEPLVCIVVPTRELAVQIFMEARKLCYRSMLRPCVVYGGGPVRNQIDQLSLGCDILIATPGRLIDFMDRPNNLTMKRLRYMVIDEADEMLHGDWEQDLNTILGGGGKSYLPSHLGLSSTQLTQYNRTGNWQHSVHAVLGHLPQGFARAGWHPPGH